MDQEYADYSNWSLWVLEKRKRDRKLRAVCREGRVDVRGVRGRSWGDEKIYDQCKSHEILRINENMGKCQVEKKREEEKRKSPFLTLRPASLGPCVMDERLQRDEA